MKHHRIVAIKMAPAVLCHKAGKLRNGLDLAVRAMVLHIAYKLKAHVVRKTEINSKERFKDKENF